MPDESKPTREPEVSERDSHLTEMPSPTRATDRAPLGTGQANMGSRSETSASNRGSILARFRMWRLRRRIFTGRVLVAETVYPDGTYALAVLSDAVDREFPDEARFDA